MIRCLAILVGMIVVFLGAASIILAGLILLGQTVPETNYADQVHFSEG